LNQGFQADHPKTAENIMKNIKKEYPQKKITSDSAALVTHDFLTALLQIEHGAE